MLLHNADSKIICIYIKIYKNKFNLWALNEWNYNFMYSYSVYHFLDNKLIYFIFSNNIRKLAEFNK